ncbi:hypothetical protein ACHAWO_012294, partial [Cyclotella atomus]
MPASSPPTTTSPTPVKDISLKSTWRAAAKVRVWYILQ